MTLLMTKRSIRAIRRIVAKLLQPMFTKQLSLAMPTMVLLMVCLLNCATTALKILVVSVPSLGMLFLVQVVCMTSMVL